MTVGYDGDHPSEVEIFVEFLVETAQGSIDSDFLRADEQSRNDLESAREHLIASVSYLTKLADDRPYDHEKEFAHAQIWAALGAAFQIGHLASVSKLNIKFLRQKSTGSARAERMKKAQVLRDIVSAELRPMTLSASDTPAKLAEAIIDTVRGKFPPRFNRPKKDGKTDPRPPYPSVSAVKNVIKSLIDLSAEVPERSVRTPLTR